MLERTTHLSEVTSRLLSGPALAVGGARCRGVARRAAIEEGSDGVGRHPGCGYVRGEGVVDGGGGPRGRRSHRRRRVDEGDETSHLLEGVRLHEDIVLGKQQGGDLRQLAHGRAVGVRDDGAQFVERVVQVVHASSLAGVDAQSAPPLALRLAAGSVTAVVVSQSLQIGLRRAAAAVVLAAARRAPRLRVVTRGSVLHPASLAGVRGDFAGRAVPTPGESHRGRRRIGHGAGEIDGQTAQVERRRGRHLGQVGGPVGASGVQDRVHVG